MALTFNQVRTLIDNSIRSGAPSSLTPTRLATVMRAIVDAAQGQAGLAFSVVPPTSTISNLGIGDTTTYYIAPSGGTPPYTFAVTSGALPDGGSLDAASGLLTITPTALGTYTATIRVADSVGYTVSVNYTWVVRGLSITPSSGTATLTVGLPRSITLTVAGGTAPYTWIVRSGNLPLGYTLNSSTGVLGGTPTAVGTYTATIRVTDADGIHGDAVYTWNVQGVEIAPASSTGYLTVGFASSITLAGAGGSPPYTWTVSDGTLMPDLSLNSSSGLLSGTPATAGQWTATVRATDSASRYGEVVYTHIVKAALTVDPAGGTTGYLTKGYPVAVTLTAAGGRAPYSFWLYSGSMPPGHVLSSNGLLQSNPTTPGTYNATIRVRDADGTLGEAAYTWVVSNPLTINPASSTGYLTVGFPAAVTIAASGGTSPYTWKVAAGQLPPGHVLDEVSGTLTAAPTTPGTYYATIQATDAHGIFGRAEYQWTVSVPLSITPASSTGYLKTNTAASITLAVTGGAAPYTWSKTSGSFPTGMTLNASTGVFSGTPTVAGSWTAVVRATDAHGIVGEVTYIWVVSAGISISPASSTGYLALNVPQTVQLAASGGTGPYTWTVSAGTMPPGHVLNASTGLLSANPTVAGTYTATIRATDSLASFGEATYTWVVRAGISVTPSSGITNYLTIGYSGLTIINASGGSSPYTFALIGGQLPPGLSLSSAGVLSINPTQTGTWTGTVRVTDNVGSFADVTYTWVVNNPVAISPPSGTTGYLTVGQQIAVTLTPSGGVAPYTWVVQSGVMPPGHVLNAQTGVLSANPTQSGTWTATIRVIDARGTFGEATYTWVVS